MLGTSARQFVGLLIGILVILVNPAENHSFIGNAINHQNFRTVPLRHQEDHGNSLQDLERIRTEERITGFGYPVEMHEVTTEDGYILTMHRIPPRNSSTTLQRRKPVLFQHGGIGDSFSWLFNHPDRIIPNVRGTIYSRKHKYFTDRDPEFFDFSIDEIARYDIPAEIDYILNLTGESKLFIIGISLGPPEVHMTLSLLPQYNEKVSLITSLAPTVYGSKTFPTVRVLNILGDNAILLKKALDFISGGTGEFPPHWVVKLVRTSLSNAFQACQMPIISSVCGKLSYILYGAPTHPDKLKVFPLGISHALAPISTRLADHFVQWLRTERFQHYDFGPEVNVRVYGTTQPPLYFLKDTTAPVAVFYAENDFLVVPADVARLVSELSNVVQFHRIDSKSWNHVDFLTGHDVNELFTNQLIELFEKYN